MEVDTVWVLEHFLKDADDLRAYLDIPDEVFQYQADGSNLFHLESQLVDAGIVMVETADPICQAAREYRGDEY